MQKSPFSGTGAGKGQLTGSHEISHFTENTGPKAKSGSQKSHGPSVQSETNEVKRASWSPKGK